MTWNMLFDLLMFAFHERTFSLSTAPAENMQLTYLHWCRYHITADRDIYSLLSNGCNIWNLQYSAIIGSLATCQRIGGAWGKDRLLQLVNGHRQKKNPFFLTSSQDAGQQKHLVLVGQPATGPAEDEGLITTIISCQSQEHLVGLHGMGLWAVVILR